MALALEGIKVVDASQVAAVPMAARHLADFGAEVIHIENPAGGDFWRGHHRPGGAARHNAVQSPINYSWENFNRNKRSMTLNLSQQGGQKVLYKMVEKADVFMCNFRPYELEKFNLGYEKLRQINPRLVYASLNGFGGKGADKDAPAFDASAYWVRGGLQYMLTGAAGATPPGFRPAFGDSVAALIVAMGIMIALFVRERTGVGQAVEASLLQTALYQMSFDVAGALVTGRDFSEWRVRSREELLNPLAMQYRTKDGRRIAIMAVQPDPYWSRFCQAIERADLEHDPRFASFEPRTENHVELLHILDEVFLTRTLDEWKARLEGVPFAVEQNLLEVINDPQARANDFFVPFDHPTYGRMEVVANPVKLSETPATIRMPAPEFGQHTEEVLLEHGYTWDDIAQLKEQGIIA